MRARRRLVMVAAIALAGPAQAEPEGIMRFLFDNMLNGTDLDALSEGLEHLGPIIGGLAERIDDPRNFHAPETLPNGVSHDILNITRQASDQTPIYTVPEGHYFFMGDNRDNSTDSRVPQSIGGVGYVPYENIVGRADRIMFSSAGRSMLFFWTWRGDRFFKRIE